jgi:hypothetical protein
MDLTVEAASKYYCVLFCNIGRTRLQRRCAADLASLCTTSSSGGRQISASPALVGVVRIAPVIPKHANLWVLLSFFLALVI